MALLAKKNLSFNLLNELVETLHCIANGSKGINGMTCSATKGTYLLTECLAVNAHETLIEKMKNGTGFSLLCDKATDITMKKIFCVNVRLLDEMDPATYLYRLIPVEQGDSDGLFNSLEAALKKDGIGWEKVVGYASDGENLMQGQSNSVLTRIKSVARDIYVLKCFCHSFHHVASHACECLSQTAEQLVHDVYNYFKNSPNRQKSFEQFQHFVQCQPHKILKPCQTRWLSLSQCVTRILQQWPALLLYFTSEIMDAKSPPAERIHQALQSPYIKGTIEFMEFVLGDLAGLNAMFQSESFKLHCLLPEVERVLKVFCNSFLKTTIKNVMAVDVDKEMDWHPLSEVYPGIMASETVKEMRPHEKESFLKRCRNWYREAVRQILKRVDVSDPVLNAMKDITPRVIVKDKAAQTAAGTLAKHLPRLKGDSSLLDIDRQWRSLLIDDVVKNGGWENQSVNDFWKAMKQLQEYESLALFMLNVTALPQSTAAVERTFSKININKTKLRNCLAVNTLESIVKVSEKFTTNFDIDEHHVRLHANARNLYMQRYTQKEIDNIDNNISFE